MINQDWRPFTFTIAKRERKIAAETAAPLPSRIYRMSQGSVGQVFAVCGSFFQHAIDEGLQASLGLLSRRDTAVY